jgi:hypothetical protein
MAFVESVSRRPLGGLATVGAAEARGTCKREKGKEERREE